MQIDYNYEGKEFPKYLKILNESLGITLIKKKILLNKKVKIRTWLEDMVIYLVLYSLMLLLIKLEYQLWNLPSIFNIFYHILQSGYLIFIFYLVFMMIILIKKIFGCKRGSITFMDTYLVDRTVDNKEIKINYSDIVLIVISKNLVNIITKNNLLVAVSRRYQENILNIILQDNNIQIYDYKKN